MENQSVGKRGFIQQTSKYLKLAEELGALVITHNGQPVLFLQAIHERTVDDLRGFADELRIEGDINEPILPGFDEWEKDE